MYTGPYVLFSAVWSRAPALCGAYELFAATGMSDAAAGAFISPRAWYVLRMSGESIRRFQRYAPSGGSLISSFSFGFLGSVEGVAGGLISKRDRGAEIWSVRTLYMATRSRKRRISAD